MNQRSFFIFLHLTRLFFRVRSVAHAHDRTMYVRSIHTDISWDEYRGKKKTRANIFEFIRFCERTDSIRTRSLRVLYDQTPHKPILHLNAMRRVYNTFGLWKNNPFAARSCIGHLIGWHLNDRFSWNCLDVCFEIVNCRQSQSIVYLNELFMLDAHRPEMH